MWWDTLLGFVSAVFLLALVSILLTSLVGAYQTLFERRLKHKVQRPDLIPLYARFAAVATIAMLVVLALMSRL